MKKVGCWLSVCLLLCCSCTSKNKETDSNTKGCDGDTICDVGNRADMSSYEGFMENEHQFIEVPMRDFLLKLDADATGIYYFGYSTCPWCIEALPIMNEAAKELGLTIFYIDKKAATTTDEDCAAIEERIGDILDKDEDGKPHLYVPFVVTIKEGEITAHHLGTVDEHDAHERKMSEDEKAALKQLYRKMFETVK